MNTIQKGVLSFILFISYFYFFISSSGLNCSNDGSHLALALAFKNEKSAVVQKYASSFNLVPDYALKDSVMYSDRLPGNAFLMNFVLEYSDLFKSFFIDNFDSVINYQITSATLLPNLSSTLAM